MNKSKILNVCDKVAFILLCILLCDCCILGAGRIISFGAISYRMIILALIMVVSIPLMLSQIKRIIKNKYFIVVILFAAWLVIATVIGMMNENRTSLIISDIKGFMYFVLLPAAMCILNSKDRIHSLMKAMMYASAFSALAILVSLCLFLWVPDVYNVINKVLSSGMVATFSIISPKMPRMFFKSVMYLLFGCAFSVYFQAKSKKKLDVRYMLITALCLFGMFMTFTRSVYLGAFIAALGTVVFIYLFGKKEERIKMFCHVGGSVAIFLAVVLLFSGITHSNYLGFAIMRSTASENIPGDTEIDTEVGSEDGTEDDTLDEEDYQNHYIEITIKSDQIRVLTLQGLYRNIAASPIVGLGLGAEFEERPDGLNEYFYLDLWSKAGIIGLALYMSPIFLMIRTIVKRFKEFTMDQVSVLIAFSILAGFLAFSWFNPYMNAALGIIFYCCVIAMFNCMEGDK